MSDDARPVLSARELNITPAEHKAILEIRDHFAARTFIHDPGCDTETGNGFNMDYSHAESPCGTTCCIGGWMWHAMNRDRTTDSPTAGLYVAKHRSDALAPLFFPFCYDSGDHEIALSDITPGAALVAIDNFLATREPDWCAACGLNEGEVREDA